jgi:hypothetical protein
LAAKLAYTATTLFQKEKDVCTLNAVFAAEKQFKNKSNEKCNPVRSDSNRVRVA